MKPIPSLKLCVFISLLPLLVLFPRLWLFIDFPLSPKTWELIDPSVSEWVIVPGHRVLSNALFQGGSLLWSAMRGLGLPLLGNELQAAPLFPLTWICILVPEPYYWTVFIFARLFLGGLGVALIATRIFHWSSFSTLVFVTSFAYGTALLQYLNHPFVNGVVAGIWYLYFLCQFLKQPKYANGIGILLVVYSLVTCGFPESSLLSGLLAIIVSTGFCIHHKSFSSVPALIFWHLVAFALSSFQIFSVVEFLRLTPENYRLSVGLHQFSKWDVFLPMVARLQGVPSPSLVHHHFGMVILGLSLLGFLRMLSKKKITWREITAITSLAFILLKIFPVWPVFNRFVAGFPIADMTDFMCTDLYYGYGLLHILRQRVVNGSCEEKKQTAEIWLYG